MASLAGLSASVTRILFLTGFPKELKTKDIQSAFSEWDGVNGGYKIKWRDDTSLYVVFADASVAKRAYLHTLAYPPAILTAPDGVSASVKPYDGPDAQSVIQSVITRGGQHQPSASRHSNRAASISVFPHRPPQNGGAALPSNPGFRSNNNIAGDSAREPSPTLPSLPSQPTLNSLISSSFSNDHNVLPSDPAILATSGEQNGPRIGDPGKRMLTHHLGVKQPRSISNTGGFNDMQRPMGGLVGVAE